MKCIRCGYIFDEGQFCPECGKKYDKEEAIKLQEENILELKKAKIEQENLKIKKLEYEAKQNEINEKRLKEQKEQEELRRKEEEEKRTLELEKAKVEQERLAVKKLEYEAELARQQNEKKRIEQEMRDKMVEQEKKTLYEMSKNNNAEGENSINLYSILCFILSIATYPLTLTVIFWLPALIASIVFGVVALQRNTKKKGFVIGGFIIDGVFAAVIVLAIIVGIIESIKSA